MEIKSANTEGSNEGKNRRGENKVTITQAGVSEEG